MFKPFLINLLLCLSVFAQTSFVIKNVMIIDGSGRMAFRGDVRVKGNKINKIGNLKPKKDEVVIEANGKILAPGFWV